MFFILKFGPLWHFEVYSSETSDFGTFSAIG
jgi:hypothetical protein